MNSREAAFLGWLTFVTWFAFISAALPDIHWALRWPLALGIAFLALQLFTMGVALALQKTVIARGICSPHRARAWHTRGHIILLIVISAGVFGLGLGSPALNGLGFVWVLLGILNLCVALQEQAKQRQQ